MRPAAPLALLFATLFLSPLFPQADTDKLMNQFSQTAVSDRLNFLKAQAPAAFPDDFLLKALVATDEARVETGSLDEQEAKKSTAIWLIQNLAARRLAAAVSVIEGLPRQYTDPFLRGEAWFALAKLGDKNADAEMVIALHSANFSGTRTRPEEIQASYLVQAFGLDKAPEAFSEVLKASIGWYSPQSKVRETARKILPSLSADYTVSLLGVIRGDPDLAAREGALELLTSQGDAALSARGGAAVLDSFTSLLFQDAASRDTAERMLKTGLRLCLQAPTPPPEVVKDLRRILDSNSDKENSVLAVRLLGKIADDPSVEILSQSLMSFNSRQKTGANSASDILLVREIITALGTARNPGGKNSLSQVEFSDYTPAIKHEAAQALEKIGK